MFMVGLTTEVFDPAGSFVAEPLMDSALCPAARRVSRTATLDGNAVLEDLGYTPADATLTIQFRIRSPEEEARLLRLIRIYPILNLSTQYGAYRGVADLYTPSPGKTTLRFLVQSQLSA